VSYAERFAFPDVMARFGRRRIGWFELGLGAYDASTTLRPGLYLGGAWGPKRVVQLSAHLGAHLANGDCCATVLVLGWRGELSLTHEFTSRISAGAGLAVFDVSQSSESDARVVEGSARLAFAL
jgi:hypothetical protein